MKKLYITLVLAILAAIQVEAQVAELWITGSAVPGGTQKLENYPSQLFKFHGTLNQGEVKIMDTPTPTSTTKYYQPVYEASYIVNKGTRYRTTGDATAAGWIVSFAEDRYRFTVDTRNMTVQGELFVPWHQLYIAGGCTDCGWESYVMLPFARDTNDTNVFTWTGYLRDRAGEKDASGKDIVESKRFKLQGQNNWGPKSLHPYIQDEDATKAAQVCTGGDDTKWTIPQDGMYKITVNVFKETIKCEFVGEQHAKNSTTGVEKVANGNITLTSAGNTIYLKANEELQATVYGIDSQAVCSNAGSNISMNVGQKGVYIVKAQGKTASLTKKIILN